MNDADLLAQAADTEERLARATNALGPILQVIRGFEGVDAHERNPRLNVDPDGTPTDEAAPPTGWILCGCGETLPPTGEFVTCWRCGRTTCTVQAGRDDVPDAALKPDQSRASRASIARHLSSIDRSVNRLMDELARWCRPSKAEVEALRKAADGEVAQDAADHDQWCRTHYRHGLLEPRSTQATYQQLGMCEGCGKLYAAFLREPHVTDPAGTLDRLVKAGHTPTPTATQVAAAAKVTVAQVADAPPMLRSGRRLPSSVRTRDGQPHHTTDDYLDTTGMETT